MVCAGDTSVWTPVEEIPTCGLPEVFIKYYCSSTTPTTYTLYATYGTVRFYYNHIGILTAVTCNLLLAKIQFARQFYFNNCKCYCGLLCITDGVMEPRRQYFSIPSVSNIYC